MNPVQTAEELRRLAQSKAPTIDHVNRATEALSLRIQADANMSEVLGELDIDVGFPRDPRDETERLIATFHATAHSKKQ